MEPASRAKNEVELMGTAAILHRLENLRVSRFGDFDSQTEHETRTTLWPEHFDQSTHFFHFGQGLD